MKVDIRISVWYDEATVEDEEHLRDELEAKIARSIERGLLSTSEGLEVVDLHKIHVGIAGKNGNG